MTFNFDLNHGASKPIDDPRGRDISDRVNGFIDAAFFAARAAEPKREYVGASAIGNECLRAVQFAYAGVKPDRVPASNMLRIWRTGHVFEAEICAWLNMAGFKVEPVDAETGKQFGFTVCDEEGQGHFDGICTGGPIDLAYPFLWECKALNTKNWSDVKKKGLYISKPIYAAQVAIGQGYLDLTNPAMFTALNKNDSSLYHERVPFDQQLSQHTSDKMALVIQSTRDHQLLPRAFSSNDHYKCKWCDFGPTCWGMKR